MRISGPLEIWPFPVLNTLITIAEASDEEQDTDSFTFKEYNVVRNDEGSIERVEIVKGDTDE